uniref:CENP-T/Histone H4 histone fold domain-containing protein n=1 Tax=Ciona savignyi TaxID=51511 RepID=H2ZPY6_CIOSA
MSDPSLVLHRIPETLVEALMMSLRKSKVEELQLRTSVLKPKSKVVVPSMRKLLTTEQSNKASKSVGRKLPVPSNQIRDIVQHHCSNKLTKGAVEAIEVSFEKFFKYLCRDVMAICLHAGKKIVTQADIELVMKRQRFIKDNKSLQILIEQNFPLEYRQLFIPVASSVTLKQRKKN